MPADVKVERLIRLARALPFDDRKKIIRAIEKPSVEEYSEVKRRAVQARWARRNEGLSA
jgi:preprotein translocase subunit Sss1